MHSISGVLSLLTALAVALLLFKPDRRTTLEWVIVGLLIFCIGFFH